MAKQVSIPITDDGAQCENGYNVRYKLTADMDWTVIPGTFASSPITIDGLSPSTSYDFEITRVCCDLTLSDPTIETFVTTA